MKSNGIMRMRLTAYFLATVLFFAANLVNIPVYAQNNCSGVLLGSPLESSLVVTSQFGSPHYGVDYRAAEGDNVLAVADGKIDKIGYNLINLKKPNPRTGLMVQGFGRYVVIEHADGSSKTLYAHLLMNSTNHLTVGMPVIKGMIIGNADSTGGVTSPHLHFQYSPNGKIFHSPSLKDPHPCIVICPETPATLTVSGPDIPYDGAQYTASGGTAPYTWSISRGTITQEGVATVSGECGGPVTITVTDSCGTTEQRAVNIPVSEIAIAGPHMPSDGSQYAASGGFEPYSWSMSRGFITQGGVVAISGQCAGPATVTAVDSCGASGNLGVEIFVAELSISGPDAPVNGSQYAGSGGVIPYAYGTSCGSITGDGVVTVSGCCGPGNVAVTDKCASYAQKQIRLPDGGWRLVSDGNCGGVTQCETYEGKYKYAHRYGIYPCSRYGCGIGGGGPCVTDHACYMDYVVYEWVCQ